MVKININMSNRAIYTVLALVIVVLAGVSVYALSLGGEGDPGHNIQDVGPPTTCPDGSYLKFISVASGWGCETPAGGSDWGLCTGGVCYTSGSIKLETASECIIFQSGGQMCSGT